MFFQHLENTAGIRQGHVPFGNTVCIFIESPCIFIVLAFFFFFTGEKTVIKRKIFVYEERRVGVIAYLVFDVFIVFQNIFDHTAQKSNIRTGAKRHMEIAAGRCSRITGIDMDNRRSLFFCSHNPLESDGVMFRGIAAHNQNDIRVFQITVVVRHGTASERLSQSRYRWAVSDPGLVIDINQTQSTAFDAHQPTFFIIYVGTAVVADCFAAID